MADTTVKRGKIKVLLTLVYSAVQVGFKNLCVCGWNIQNKAMPYGK